MNIILLPYLLLFLTIAALWLPSIKRMPVWPILFLLMLLAGWYTQQMTWEILLPIISFAIGMLLFTRLRSPLLQVLSGLLIIVLSIGLGMHLFPGFRNLLVIDHVQLTRDAVPYTMVLTFDKPLAGILLLGIGIERIARLSDWANLFKRNTGIMLSWIVLPILAALAIGFIRFEPKIPAFLGLWIITNLLLVCTAEEAFFRGFIQQSLTRLLQCFRYGALIAIVISAILFGLAHYAGGIQYIMLATLAGIGYGSIYHRTKRIEASILLHFSVNLTHILLFTYPMLMRA